MKNELALIRDEPEGVVATFPAGTDRLRLPIGLESYVHAPADGWTGEGFRITAVLPADLPTAGKVIVGRTVVLVDGVPVEVLTVEDAAPEVLAPREPTRAQCESALYHYTLPDGTNPLYFAQYEGLLLNHAYPPLRIWAKGAAVWRENHSYVMALAAVMEPPIDDAEKTKLFDMAMTFES